MILPSPNNGPAPWESPEAPKSPPVVPPTPSYIGKSNREWDAQYGGNVGGTVSDRPGYSWYHTGALGGSQGFGGADWIQAQTGAFGGSAPPGPTASPSSPQTQQQALQQPVTAGSAPQQGQPTSVASAFQQALVNRLAPAPVSAQSAEIAPAIAANRASEQRGFERNRAQVAERAASQGLDPTAFNSQLLGMAQERAGREGQFAGQAVLGLAQQRAQELTSALALGGSMLSEQDRMSIQRELAQLQAQLAREGHGLQREGLALQGDLGRGDLSLREMIGSGQLNLGLMNAMLGNDQFNKNLGANIGMFNVTQGNNNLQSLLEMIFR